MIITPYTGNFAVCQHCRIERPVDEMERVLVKTIPQVNDYYAYECGCVDVYLSYMGHQWWR